MTLQLREGGFYLDGHGNVVGPMGEIMSDECTSGCCRYEPDPPDRLYCAETGRRMGGSPKDNLVREYHGVLRVGGKYRRRGGGYEMAVDAMVDGTWVGIGEYNYGASGKSSIVQSGQTIRPGYFCESTGNSPSDVTYEVLPDGTEVRLAPDWDTHDALIAHLDGKLVARREIELVAERPTEVDEAAQRQQSRDAYDAMILRAEHRQLSSRDTPTYWERAS